MLRRPLALLLLTAHVAAAAHLALGAHVAGDSGAIVDAQPLCSQAHGSAGIAHGHELQREETECQVVASVRTAAETFSTSVAFATKRAAAVPAVGPAVATPPLEVLSVAPKSSPPA